MYILSYIIIFSIIMFIVIIHKHNIRLYSILYNYIY